MKKWLVLILIPFLLACAVWDNGWKELDLSAFRISIPKNWQYKKEHGIDSFVGKFVASSSASLSFAFSNSGYANSLLPTEEEYLNNTDWKRECYFCKTGVTYTANFNVKNERAAQMKKLGTTDPTLVKVEADPSYETKTHFSRPTEAEKAKYPRADYIATLTYQDSTIHISIQIPTAIKAHHIRVDTSEKYIVKTIWPRVVGKGMTGVYFKSRASSLNLRINGLNLSSEQQDLALKAFESIIIKE